MTVYVECWVENKRDVGDCSEVRQVPGWRSDMSPTLIVFVVCVMAHTWAVPLLNIPGTNNKKRFQRELSEEFMPQNEMTAMDKIMRANEYQEGSGFREGDIAVSNKRGSRSCFARSCLWPKSVDGNVYIAYTLSSEYNDLDLITIQEGMEAIENGTCVRFVPRTHQNDYLDIQPKSGCWSYLGLHGGPQIISLQAPDCVTTGVTSHELMHALGFVHEQSRADRDKYVAILWGNIWKEHVQKFEKYKTNNLDTPYDYASIMHFGKYAYSEDGDPTIIPKGNLGAQLGQRFAPSELDKFKINKLYKCDL
ncbi:hatching enzyme 1.2-like isoform X2 [Brienomyrus brachyistius]|uniref:hatching enzyme 1.2-like isoform X2 n=1 Tax=Brienomyrus brachyistius TaxID=42636 RepID=UPI0020B3C768|nr:hatching enzyme 1.2-like isoform X2 [Brienomyrus brachyistius]